MTAVAYLGSEIGAAGFRLAGVDAAVAAPGDETAALARACGQATLVLVSAEVAARVDPQALQRACAAPAPLVLVVPDPQGQAALPDLAQRLRIQLGLES